MLFNNDNLVVITTITCLAVASISIPIYLAYTAYVQTSPLGEEPQDGVQLICTELGHMTESPTSVLSPTRDGVANVGVQTDLLPTNILPVDTIAEYPNIAYPIMEPTVLIKPVLHQSVGLQTSNDYLQSLFTGWLKEQFSVTSSEVASMINAANIEKWINQLDVAEAVPTQSIASNLDNSIHSAGLTPTALREGLANPTPHKQ